MASIGIVIPVNTGIQTYPRKNRELTEKTCILCIKCGAGPAGVYSDGNRGRNDGQKNENG